MQTPSTTRPLLDLRPGPGPELVPVPPSAPLWPWLLGGAVVIALVVGWLLGRRRPLGRTPLQKFEAAVEEAGKRVNAEPTAALTALAAAARRFLEAQFEMPALPRTTEEMLPALARDERIPADAKSEIAVLLQDADRANFGGVRFTAAEALAHQEAVKRWLKASCAVTQTARHETPAS